MLSRLQQLRQQQQLDGDKKIQFFKIVGAAQRVLFGGANCLDKLRRLDEALEVRLFVHLLFFTDLRLD